MLEKIAGGIAVEGMESLAPMLVDGMEPLSSVLPETRWCSATNRSGSGTEPTTGRDQRGVPARCLGIRLRRRHRTVDASGVATIPGGLGAGSFATLAELRAQVLEANQSWWQYGIMGMDTELDPELPEANSITLPGREPKAFGGHLERLCAHVRDRAAENWQIVVVTEGPGSAQRLADLFIEEGISVHRVEQLDEEPRRDRHPDHGGHRLVSPRRLKFGLLSEAEVLGRSILRAFRNTSPEAAQRGGPAKLKEGLRVHEQHGS